MKQRSVRVIVLALLGVFTLGTLFVDDAWARKSRSSGGYSRSSSSFRTPSTSSYSRPRTPSTSSGYRRPSPTSHTSSTTSSVTLGSTDRAIARQSSGQALNDFRTASAPPVSSSRTPTTTPLPSAPRRPSTTYRSGSSTDWDDIAEAAIYSRAYRSQPRTRPRPSSFGPWSALLLWGLLETATRPGHADFFYHHAQDPSIQAWRAEADALAQDDPGIAKQLATLDQQVATLSGARNPNYPPPYHPSPPATSGFPWGGVLLLLAVMVLIGFILLKLWRRFSGDVAQRIDKQKPQGSSTTGSGLFRLGMTLPVDPSLFILATPYSAITPPETDTASGLLSVEAVGEARTAETRWHRLYLSNGQAFFQVHLDANGEPDECRYFSRLDEVMPADADEWGVWLDADEGLIGWPQFQTRDGQLYQRIWAQGETRIEPMVIEEHITSLNASRQRRQQSMLYARATGASAPSPETEYLLVAANEQDDGAWISIEVGIDVPVAALQLS